MCVGAVGGWLVGLRLGPRVFYCLFSGVFGAVYLLIGFGNLSLSEIWYSIPMLVAGAALFSGLFAILRSCITKREMPTRFLKKSSAICVAGVAVTTVSILIIGGFHPGLLVPCAILFLPACLYAWLLWRIQDFKNG